MDPNFAPGWATLAEVYGMMVPSQKNFASADPTEAYARKAIELAPNLAAGHSALAFAMGFKGPVRVTNSSGRSSSIRMILKV